MTPDQPYAFAERDDEAVGPRWRAVVQSRDDLGRKRNHHVGPWRNCYADAAGEARARLSEAESRTE